MPREVTLIGAGLAGSLLATFLARRGYHVTVFERRPDLRKVAISAGRSINLALANRGIRALRQVGLMNQIEPLLIPMAGRMLHDERGNLQFVPYGNKPHEVIYSVSRGALNAVLMNGAEAAGEVDIRFEHTCTGVDFQERTVAVTGGPSSPVQRPASERRWTWDAGPGTIHRIQFDVLIGTDGSASEVREAIIRATGGTSTEEPLDHSYKELMIAPAEASRHNMDRHSLHIWPRGEFMLIALPNPDGSFTATLFLPNRRFDELTDETNVRRFFEMQFSDSVRLIPDVERQFFNNPTGRLGTVRCWPWHYQDLALILGDAAHAIVPFHGQGMNAAFEDCVALDECLSSAGGDWQLAFERFAAERKPNADAIADMALENYVEMRSSVRDPMFLRKKELSFRLEERFPDRFIPRYSMVMFHDVPYAEAQRRGTIQEEILDELARDNEIDYEKAAALIETRLDPVR